MLADKNVYSRNKLLLHSPTINKLNQGNEDLSGKSYEVFNVGDKFAHIINNVVCQQQGMALCKLGTNEIKILLYSFP